MLAITDPATHPKAASAQTAKLAGVTLIHFWLDGQTKMAEWCARK